jgi:hypothetical protein
VKCIILKFLTGKCFSYGHPANKQLVELNFVKFVKIIGASKHVNPSNFSKSKKHRHT